MTLGMSGNTSKSLAATTEGHFDVIIVGAGLAGLSAASALTKRHCSILMLEANSRIGGKVYTARQQGVTYEKGALFAFDPGCMPFPVQTGELFSADDPVGVFINNFLITGYSVQECIRKAGANPRHIMRINTFLGSPAPQVEMIGATLHSMLQAFFKVIHPGDLDLYIQERRFDCLIRYDISSFANGNESLVQALAQHVHAEIRTGCRVNAIHAGQDQVTADWSDIDGSHSAKAKWLILATPALEAQKLVADSSNVAKDFLGKIRYGEGVVVILGVQGSSVFQRFSYLVCPHGFVNTFFFRNIQEQMVLITAYIVAAKAESCAHMTDQQIVDRVISELQSMPLGSVGHDEILWADVCRWPAVGPIISPESYQGFSHSSLRPFDRVVLAGDYTWWDQQCMPYGMKAAIDSGQRAADMVSLEPEVALSTTFHAAPLSVTEVIVFTESGPRLSDRIEDGSIAYYGLLLIAEPDVQMERYLVGEAIEGLWSYHPGYTVTSLDSALVMEGLMNTGRHRKLLNRSADRLVELFFDVSEGGFCTLPLFCKGRAPYWSGADCPATAYCAWLLQQIAPKRYAEIIMACARYLKRKQLISGNWPAKWFSSDTIPVFYALRLLSTLGNESQSSFTSAYHWLRSQQKSNGSWKESVIETSAAVLACCTARQPQMMMLNHACSWLRLRACDAQWCGESILQYWFEKDGKKTFFHTTDKGRITSAWARIALAEAARQGQIR